MIDIAFNRLVAETRPQPFHVQFCKVIISQELKSKVTLATRFSVYDLLTPILTKTGTSHLDTISLTHPDEQLPKNLVDSITYIRAFHEAVSHLVSARIIFAAGDLQANHYTGFTLKVGGSGATHSGSRSLKYCVPWIPESVVLGSVVPDHSDFYDPDLFLKTITASAINPDIAAFLGDAVLCFKNDLYRPAIVMLGAANEGVWIEFGRKIADALPVGSNKFQKDGFLDEIENPRSSIASKQDLVCDSFSHLPPDKQKLWRKGELQEVKEFAKYLREDRNALHFGKSPLHDDTFAKTALLMLQTGAHIKRIYDVMAQL